MNRFAKSLLASAALCVATLLPAHAEIDVISLKASIEKSVEADYPKLDALYKEIHAHPELAFEEVKTAARLAAEMRALGAKVTLADWWLWNQIPVTLGNIVGGLVCTGLALYLTHHRPADGRKPAFVPCSAQVPAE